MSEILFHYQEIYPTTWAYVSSLIIIGLFFKFSRFWSVRNLDLVLLVLLSPGLLCIYFGQEIQQDSRQMPVNSIDTVNSADQKTLGESPAAPSNGKNLTENDLQSEHSSLGENDQDLDEDRDRSKQLSLVNQDLENRSIDMVDLDPSSVDPVSVEMAPSTPASRERSRGISIESLGYVWIFAVGALFLVRLLIDPAMVRRPLLAPNLTFGGLTFVCCSLFVFLMTNVITGEPTPEDLKGPSAAEKILAKQEFAQDSDTHVQHGPGIPLLYVIPTIITAWVNSADDVPTTEQKHVHYVYAAKLMAMLCQLAIVVGLVVIGYRHFENVRAGMGAAVLYLLLPYTALMTERVMHVLPAALLVWAVVFYRRPEISGGLLGFATAAIYYPFFLLPLWIGFYWQRGLVRFVVGVFMSLALVVLSLVWITSDLSHCWSYLRPIRELVILNNQGLQGFWLGLGEAWRSYRYPVQAAYFGISLAMALWPAQKNLGTLLSCSATIMLATQYWHGYDGGLYMAWYMPLVLLTIFRPNLEDRVALAVLGNFWPSRR